MKEFEGFCHVDLRLAPRTVYGHVKRITKYLDYLESKYGDCTIDKEKIREYLGLFVDGNAFTYANVIKPIKVFHRDFLGREDFVKTFKFPRKPFTLKIVPSKEELRTFHSHIKKPKYQAIFLFLASTGLRLSEALGLKKTDLNFETRLVCPKDAHSTNNTKKAFLSFYNEECEKELLNYLEIRGQGTDERLFTVNKRNLEQVFRDTSISSGVKITPQVLRQWFCCEMGEKGMADRYVDAFCGRVPKSILARHYTDYSPVKLGVIYGKAKIRVLDQS